MEPTIKLEHADARGEIYSIALPDNRELMLLHSKAGAFRGGHSHNVDEVVVLLTGSMIYRKVNFSETDPDFVQFMKPGEISFNSAGETHMGEFREDSWVLEYKNCEKGTWQNTDFELWRERVRASQG